MSISRLMPPRRKACLPNLKGIPAAVQNAFHCFMKSLSVSLGDLDEIDEAKSGVESCWILGSGWKVNKSQKYAHGDKARSVGADGIGKRRGGLVACLSALEGTIRRFTKARSRARGGSGTPDSKIGIDEPPDEWKVTSTRFQRAWAARAGAPSGPPYYRRRATTTPSERRPRTSAYPRRASGRPFESRPPARHDPSDAPSAGARCRRSGSRRCERLSAGARRP